MKVRLKFRKYGVMKFIGHLDMMRYFQKAMRRAGIPIAYSQGFSPHMIMSFANPLGVGLTSDGEYFDIELTESIGTNSAIKQLNEVMVDGVEITGFVELPDSQKTGMSIVAAADYLVIPKECSLNDTFTDAFMRFVNEKEIVVMKKTKKSFREVDIRPLIYKIEMQEDGVFMQVATGSVENLKPELVMDALIEYAEFDKELYKFNYHRIEVYAENEKQNDGQRFVPLQQLGTEITL